MTKKYFTYITVVVACFVVSWVASSRAEIGQLSENQAKAAYLFNFAKFVEWPASAFPSAAAPMVICILGKSPLGEAIDELAGRSVKGRKVQVRQLGKTEEIAGCQVLFIASSERTHLKEILNKANLASGVLTVSDINHFCSSGGMIGLVTRGERIQFEVNRGSAERAGLKPSSHLMKLAVSVIE
jgi:hypothetical protein